MNRKVNVREQQTTVQYKMLLRYAWSSFFMAQSISV